jgi:hypothetical protein
MTDRDHDCAHPRLRGLFDLEEGVCDLVRAARLAARTMIESTDANGEDEELSEDVHYAVLQVEKAAIAFKEHFYRVLEEQKVLEEAAS